MAGSGLWEVSRVRRAEGAELGFVAANGLIVSCRAEEFGEELRPVVAYLAPALPHACFLFAGDGSGRTLVMEGGPFPATILPLRAARSAADPDLVALAAPHTGLFACAAPSDPRRVILSGADRDASQWYRLVADPAQRSPLAGMVEAIAGPLTGPAILARIQAGVPPDQTQAFLALASLLPEDQAQWLAGVLLTSPPAMQALQRLAPDDVWAQFALPALHASMQGRRSATIGRVGPELDLLAEAGLNGHPATFAHRCNALARASVAPRRTLAIVATARNEGLYLLEWVAYHRRIGVERIFLYSNDNDDGSDELLRILAEHDVITWIQSETGPGRSAQPKAYGHAFGLLPEILDYRWTLVIDLDEFLGLETGRFGSATEFLDWQETQRVDTVALDWLVFGSDGRDRWEDGPMLSRFTHRLPWVDMHVKSVTRTNLCLQSHPHIPVLSRSSPPVARTETGALLERGSSPSYNARPSAGLAWIAHYFLRSTEEFVWKNSRNRGDHALVKGLTPSLIDPEFATMFLGQHRGGSNVRDDRTLRCVPGLAAEIARLEALPGVPPALAQIRRRFRQSLEGIKASVLGDPAFGPGSPVRSVVDLIA